MPLCIEQLDNLPCAQQTPPPGGHPPRRPRLIGSKARTMRRYPSIEGMWELSSRPLKSANRSSLLIRKLATPRCSPS